MNKRLVARRVLKKNLSFALFAVTLVGCLLKIFFTSLYVALQKGSDQK